MNGKSVMPAGLQGKKILVLNDDETLCPRVQIQVDTLAGRAAEVTVVRWVRGSNPGPPLKDGVAIDVRVPGATGTAKIIFALPRLYRAVYRAVASFGFDLIIVGQLALLPLALWLGRQKRAAVIYDAREFWALDYSRHFGPLAPKVRGGLEALENWLVARVAAVFCINSQEGFLLRRYKQYNPHSAVLHNFPQLKVDRELEKDFRPQLIKTNGRYVAFVGASFKAREGAWEILEALEQVRNRNLEVDFLLIGAGNPGKPDRDPLGKIIQARPYIISLPFLPYDAMMAYLSFVKVGLALFHPQEGRYPLIGLGNSRKLFTYMQAGIPVIVSRHPAAARIVEETGCGLVVNEDSPLEIAQAIAYLMENPESAREMGLRGRAALEKKYNWKVEEPKFLEGVYRSLGLPVPAI